MIQCISERDRTKLSEKSNATVAVTYSAFHASPHNALLKEKAKAKLDFWRRRRSTSSNVPPPSSDEIPPNILIIGQDSTSRLNFRRHMTKTVKILESLGAVEMMGYTKGIKDKELLFAPLPEQVGI
jgi:hypothetical protein